MKLRGFVPNFYIHVSGTDVFLFCCIAFADQSWEYINRSQILESKNWEQGRTVSFLGIFFADFQYSAFAVHLPLSTNIDITYQIEFYIM